MQFYHAMHYSAKCGTAIACRLSVWLSVTLVDQDHIGWKTWKPIERTISPTPSLFVVGYKDHPPTPRGTWGNFGETKNLTKKILLSLTLSYSVKRPQFCWKDQSERCKSLSQVHKSQFFHFIQSVVPIVRMHTIASRAIPHCCCGIIIEQ